MMKALSLKKNIIALIVVVAVLVIGFSVYAYIKGSKYMAETQPINVINKTILNSSDGQTIDTADLNLQISQ